MYTNELKNNTIKFLLRNDKTTINPWIYRSSYVNSRNLEGLISEINRLTSFLVDSIRLEGRIYCVLNDVTEQPKCYCGNSVKFKRYQLGFATFCSCKCRATSKDWQDTVANTNFKKYGETHIAKLQEERKKRSESLKNRRPFMDSNTDSSKKKRYDTIAERYGEGFNVGWTEKAIETRVNNGTMVPYDIRIEYKEYYEEVSRWTNKQPIKLLENIELRGILGKDENAHHIDHIVSIYDGFMNDVPPEIIGNFCNLQCIPGKENIKKRNTSTITIEQLYERYALWKNLNTMI